MARGRGRKLVRRAVAGLVFAAVAAGTWAGFNWPVVRAKYAAHRLKLASTDDDRARWADHLAADDAGLPALLALLRGGDPPGRAAAAGALDRHLAALPENDPRAIRVSGQILDAFAGCDAGGREAVVELLPTILKRGGAAHAGRCREVVAAGLGSPSVGGRLTAVRAAMHPGVRMRADLLPLLNAPEADVRRAALFAVGPATDDDAVIADEDLFRWLHDPDAGVRAGCRDALLSRGRTDPEIALGRRLCDPDAGGRLKLLLDLRYDDDVADPEPWLERLSRDPDPGVRAGAARVAVEVAGERRQPPPGWVARLADADADPTVRRIAHHYRTHPPPAPDAAVRPADGP